VKTSKTSHATPTNFEMLLPTKVIFYAAQQIQLYKLGCRHMSKDRNVYGFQNYYLTPIPDRLFGKSFAGTFTYGWSNPINDKEKFLKAIGKEARETLIQKDSFEARLRCYGVVTPHFKPRAEVKRVALDQYEYILQGKGYFETEGGYEKFVNDDDRYDTTFFEIEEGNDGDEYKWTKRIVLKTDTRYIQCTTSEVTGLESLTSFKIFFENQRQKMIKTKEEFLLTIHIDVLKLSPKDSFEARLRCYSCLTPHFNPRVEVVKLAVNEYEYLLRSKGFFETVGEYENYVNLDQRYYARFCGVQQDNARRWSQRIVLVIKKQEDLSLMEP
jgi:hypothetical protein